MVDFLIVGGSAAGTTAADTIRSLLPDASITIVTDEKNEFYSRVLIPHYIRGKVKREQVFLKKSEWYIDKKIELIKGVRAEGLGSGEKIVKLSNGESIQWGKLLIAVGGKVIPLEVPGLDKAHICYMRTVEDADKIIKAASQSQKAVVIGGGFIGLEFASCFRICGVKDVTLLVMEPYFWSGKLDEESAGVIADTLVKNGVKIVNNEEVDHFEGNLRHSELDLESRSFAGAQDDKRARCIVTKSGRQFEADVIGVGIGIKSDLKWLEGTGVKINRGILTNEYLETSLPDVYAAGDCAQFKDVIFERQHIVGNWANATSQGSAVGKTMSGTRTVFETASSYSINYFDPPAGEAGGSVSFVGVTEDKFADQVIRRGYRDEGKVTRIFVKKFLGPDSDRRDGPSMRFVGATVINNPMDVAPLTMAIKNKVDVSRHIDDLGKADFDLKGLLS